MKSKFLKIAGVKTDKEFYAKYPTEESFMAKHGAAIKKAQLGGIMSGIGGSGGMLGGEGAAGMLSGLTDMNPIGMVTDMISGFKQQKENVNKANQNMQVLGHQEDATASNKLFEQQNLADARQKTYVGGDRDGNSITGEELFPIYGQQSNILAKKGAKIAQGGFLGSSGAQWGDLAKQTALGGAGEIGSALGIGGDMGSQLGGKVGGMVGSMIPIPGMDKVGELVFGGIGDMLDRSDTKIKNFENAATRSTNNMAGMNMANKVQGVFGGNMKQGGKIAQKGIKETEGERLNREAHEKSSEQARLETIRDNMHEAQNHPLWKLPGIIASGAMGGPGVAKHAKDVGTALRGPGASMGIPSGGSVINKLPKKMIENVDGKLLTHGKYVTDIMSKNPLYQDVASMFTTLYGTNYLGQKAADNIGEEKRNGDTMPGGDVQTYGQGGIKPLSNNPHGGEMGMIEGPSHDNGGVKMSIYGEQIEAEGGEPIMKMEDGGAVGPGQENVVILGDLNPAPHLKKSAEAFTGEKFTGNKYKTIGKSIGKVEAKTTSTIDKNKKKAEQYSPNNKLDSISLQSIERNVKIADNKLQKLQVVKEGLAQAQQAQNEQEEQIAKNGKTTYAQNGYELFDPKQYETPLMEQPLSPEVEFMYNDPVTQSMLRTEREERQAASNEDKGVITLTDEELNITETKPKLKPGQSPTSDADTTATAPKITDRNQTSRGNNLYGGATADSLDRVQRMAGMQSWWKGQSTDFSNPETLTKFQEAWNKNNPGATQVVVDGKFGDQMSRVRIGPDGQLKPIGPTLDHDADLRQGPLQHELISMEDPKEKSDLDWLGGIPQLWKDSDAEPFDNSQLIPEAWAMANNKLEPVQAQKFNTRLRTPYEQNFQEQRNEVTAAARSAEKLAAHNPGMLAQLKAQQYDATTKIGANEFRANQQFKDQIYSGNLEALNKQDLTNLSIADKQYVRQEQAKSKTKSTDFEALKSMTDKRLKHELENQTLRVWENMYDYRYNPSGRAQYRGPAADFSQWEVAGTEPVNQDLYEYIKGPDGKLMRQKKTKSKAKSKVPANANTPYTKISRNGSIVKKIKKFK